MFSEILKNQAGEFTLYTGNLNSLKDFKNRHFINAADEFVGVVRYLQKPGNCHLICPKNEEEKIGNFCSAQFLAEEKLVDRYSRDELKITLKIFLSEPNVNTVKHCVMEMKNRLKINFVDLLIVALPANDADHIGVAPTLSTKVLSLWPALETLVAEGHVAALGSADLDAEDLRRVWQGAKNVKPLVNHYYLSSCCSVPPELKDYAKQNDIILFTHNDPNPFLTQDQMVDILDDCQNRENRWNLEFVCKYVAMIKARSVIASKGYFAHFKPKRFEL